MIKDGLILIDKPLGYSSYDVIRVLKKITKIKRIGHTGTLDPQATGLLLVLINKGTKIASILESMNKTYEVIMLLGVETDTDDLAGKVLNRSNKEIEKNELIKTIESFRGLQLQIPSKYSAIKVDGEKAYDLAREGLDFELDPREINISCIKVNSIKGNYVFFTAKVSKGTYIRSLVRDIGKKLNISTTTVLIRRTKVDNFEVKDSFTLEDIKSSNIDTINIENIFSYPDLELGETNYFKFKNGKAFNIDKNNGLYKIYFEGEFKGLGKVTDRFLKGYKYFI